MLLMVVEHVVERLNDNVDCRIYELTLSLIVPCVKAII